MRILTTIAIGLLMFACNKSDVGNACDTDDPLNDTPWLKDLKEQFDKDMSPTRQIIIQYSYNGETVFYVDYCNLCSDALITVYDCEKNVVCEFGGTAGKNTCPDFTEKTTDKKILYDQ